jgi:hypothetical protein
MSSRLVCAVLTLASGCASLVGADFDQRAAETADAGTRPFTSETNGNDPAGSNAKTPDASAVKDADITDAPAVKPECEGTARSCVGATPYVCANGVLHAEPKCEGATSTCVAGACTAPPDASNSVTCYPDGDSDGFPGPGSAVASVGTCGARMTAKATPADCDDTEPKAFVGQAEYFSVQRPNGTFDYDCNGQTEMTFDVAGTSLEGRKHVADCKVNAAQNVCNNSYMLRDVAAASCGATTSAAECVGTDAGKCRARVPQRDVSIGVRCH